MMIKFVKKQAFAIAGLFLVIGLIIWTFVIFNADRNTVSKLEDNTEKAWRQRFEEKLRRERVAVSAEEKEILFKKYMNAEQDRAGEIKKTLREEFKNKPLRLTGKVVDQDGVPVPKAEIKATVEVSNIIGEKFNYLQSYDHEVTAKTDSFGNFTLDGGRGRSINIQKITVPGYLFFIEQQVFTDFYADKSVAILMPHGQKIGNEHVVFKMWKQKGPLDKLVVEEVYLRLPQDGGKYVFSIFRPCGKKMLTCVNNGLSLDGDIIFSVSEKDADGSVYLSIEAVDGGISDQHNNWFIAPQKGYLPIYKLDISKGDKELILFVRSRNGNVYTKLTLNASFNDNVKMAYMTVKYMSNPEGRPNLQPGGGRYPSHLLEGLEEKIRVQVKESDHDSQ
jgi:hypothetical protein